MAFCVAVIAAAVDQRQANPLEPELLMCGQRITAHLPTEALQLARNGDQAALSAWMQTRMQIGIRYLPDDAVVAQANVLRRLLAAAPPADCAALADRTITRSALDAILNELGRQDAAALRTWCDVRERTLVESLKSTHAEAFPISEAEVIAAVDVLYQGLSETDRARWARIVDDYEGSSAEDRCWYARTTVQGIEEPGQPARRKLARVVLGQEIDK
jgi:hypothetical protein